MPLLVSRNCGLHKNRSPEPDVLMKANDCLALQHTGKQPQ